MSLVEAHRSFSHGFLRLIKQVGEATSKQEEEQIIRAEINTLTKALTSPQTTKPQLKGTRSLLPPFSSTLPV